LGVEEFRTALGRHRHVGIDSNVFIYHLDENVGIDSNVFIYHLDENPKYLPLTDCFFSWLEFENCTAVTSTVTMIEVLVKPYRDSDAVSADKCRGLLSIYPNLEWISPGLALADLAAEIRAIHRLRTPDALQAATALQAGATAIVTNDPDFNRVVDLKALVLDDYI
jgi:predicted nucleic acid-binding protein